MTDSSQPQSSQTQTCRRQFLLRTIASCSAGALLYSTYGCQLFSGKWSDVVQRTSLLSGIPAARNTVELEVIFIERPLGDPLLGNALWKEIDQIGALEPDVRNILKKNGLKVGVTASEPPDALQTMLAKAKKKRLQHPSKPHPLSQIETASSRNITVIEGTDSHLQTSQIFSSCDVTIKKLNQHAKQKSFTNARCLFRVEAERLQDGWVTLRFIPEIHHGSKSLRPTAGERNWKLTTGQAIHPLYEQQFKITLNMGEMAVITSLGQSSHSIGQRFFMGTNQQEDKVQRLLVVRLKNIASAKAIKTE